MTRKLGAFVLAWALSVMGARAAVLIEIDISNPNAVTFTATANFSEIDDNSVDVFGGVTLEDFFTSSATINFPTFTISTLTPAGSSESYVWYGNTYGDLSDFDLNFISPAADPQEFTTSTPAFTGSATADLSAFSLALPGIGSSGAIVVGDSVGGSGLEIGQWSVVPEPATLALAGCGLATMFLRRRR